MVPNLSKFGNGTYVKTDKIMYTDGKIYSLLLRNEMEQIKGGGGLRRKNRSRSPGKSKFVSMHEENMSPNTGFKKRSGRRGTILGKNLTKLKKMMRGMGD